MIIDLEEYIRKEEQTWQGLETILSNCENDFLYRLTLDEVKHFYYLYERVISSLSKIKTYSYNPDIVTYLESLVARANLILYKKKKSNIRPWRWFLNNIPLTFRKYYQLFLLSLLITVIGSLFGGYVVITDNSLKSVIMPFSHLLGNPKDRVKEEENSTNDRMKNNKIIFSSYLMTNNIRVSLLVIALSMTWGIGSIIMLFYNGVILGGVAADYIINGQTKFLLGWLMPHGVIEIPAILIAGQVSFIITSALIGYGTKLPLQKRLKQKLQDITTIIFLIFIMLIWAGIIESFISQYHEPVLPYHIKIFFGCCELVTLLIYLLFLGRKKDA